MPNNTPHPHLQAAIQDNLEMVPQPYLGDLLTKVINHLYTKYRMILQVVLFFTPYLWCQGTIFVLPDQDIRQVSQAQGENLGCKHRHSQVATYMGNGHPTWKAQICSFGGWKNMKHIPEMVVNSGDLE